MKIIIKNITIFSIAALLFFMFTPLEKNNDYSNTVFYDHEGFNQYGLDRQSMGFIDNGLFPTVDREALYHLYQNEETIPKLKSIAKAYNFYNNYMIGFIRQHQTCVFNNEDINCLIYLKDKDFDSLKYQANLECKMDLNCRLTYFTNIDNNSGSNYYCKHKNINSIDGCESYSSVVENTIKSVLKNLNNLEKTKVKDNERSFCMENSYFEPESNMCISHSKNNEKLQILYIN